MAPAVERGDEGAQFALSHMYALGHGVPQDYIQAHMWFNLAASNVFGNDRDVKEREAVAGKMTPEQISDA